MKIRLELNGRELRFDDLAKEIEKSAIKEAVSSVEASIRRMRCRIHGQHARLIRTGGTGKSIRFEVQGCCSEFIEKIKSELR
jgi:hypothetical protein